MFRYYYIPMRDKALYVFRKPQVGDNAWGLSEYYNKKTKLWSEWVKPLDPNFEEITQQLYRECKHISLREVIQSVRLVDKKAEVYPY